MATKISESDIVVAFNLECIGSKVTSDKDTFMAAITPHIENYDWTKCEQPGQGFIVIDDADIKNMVSAGDGSVEGRKAEDFVVREWRGEVQHFLKREFAGPVSFLALVVYTAAAYRRDPDVTPGRQAVVGDDAEYVLVAILASAGTAGLSSTRFVRNLAGGNKEFQILDRLEAHMRELRHPGMSQVVDLTEQVNFLKAEISRLQDKAKSTVDYEMSWCVVAD
jgi:hypothetical protein